MSDFPLIKQLDAEQLVSETNHINYQSYAVTINDQEHTIKIPKRVVPDFENKFSAIKEELDHKILKNLLREFRGIRG